ncbi:hypothetical protein [Mesorhizobium sp. ANAO-SY3R2]|uniref:hypothetical protein n=1 Tax=Mesorhizobium sp. ANAO-SY3R2 TaxID=3166644 RepID=UPI00366BE1DD
MKPSVGTVCLLRSVIVTDRVWLDREALKIVAMVGKASKKHVRDYIFLRHVGAGLPADVASRDADLAVEYIDARIVQLEGLRKTLPPQFLLKGEARA